MVSAKGLNESPMVNTSYVRFFPPGGVVGESDPQRRAITATALMRIRMGRGDSMKEANGQHPILRWTTQRARTLAAVATLVLAVACGGDSGGPSGPATF